MTPSATMHPILLPGLPSELVQRTAESEVRPVDPAVRTRARSGGLFLDAQRGPETESDQRTGLDRRRPQQAGFEPSRPQPGGFLAQALGQESGTAQDRAFHLLPDAASRGSEAYRRAGAEPALYTQEPAFYRISA